MAFKQYRKGTTFSSGMSFPDHVAFENCTFYAKTTFGEGCMFVNCTFLKCCPKYYTQPNSVVKKSIMVGCSLEYITIDKETLVDNCTEKERVINQGYSRAGITHGTGQSSDRMENCCLGVTLSPTDVGTFPPCNVNPCDNIRGIQNESKG